MVLTLTMTNISIISLFIVSLSSPLISGVIPDDEWLAYGKYFSKLVVHSPCDQYHTYICGDLDRSENILNEDLQHDEIKQLIDTYIMKEGVVNLSATYFKARNYLNTCMEKNEISKVLKNIQNLDMFDYNTTWPISPFWSPSNFDWTEMSAKFMSFDKPVIIDIKPERYENQTVIAVHPKLFPVFQAVQTSTFRLNQLFGEHAEKFRYLQNGRLNKANATKEILTYGQLKIEIPEFSWNRYFRKLFGNVGSNDLIMLYNKEQLKLLINYFNSLEPEVTSFHFLFQLLTEEDNRNLFVETCYEEFFENFREIFAEIVIEHFVTENDFTSHVKVFGDFSQTVLESFQWNRFHWQLLEKKHHLEKIYLTIAKNRESFAGVLRRKIGEKFLKLRVDDQNYLQNKINLGKINMKWKFSEREHNEHVVFFLSNFVKFYRLHNKPMVFYFATLGIEFWENLLINGKVDVSHLSHCHIEGFNGRKKRIPHKNLVRFIAARKAFEHYRQWMADNKAEVDNTNKLLLQYNYNNVKLFFHIYMQYRCKDFDVYDYGFIGHQREFSDEYQCVSGEKMSYRSKCVAELF